MTAAGDGDLCGLVNPAQLEPARPAQFGGHALQAVCHQLHLVRWHKGELGVQVVGDPDCADETTYLEVHGVGHHQGEANGTFQVNFSTIDDDGGSAPSGHTRERVASEGADVDVPVDGVGGDVGAKDGAVDRVAAVVLGLRRLERNVGGHLESGVADMSVQCRQDLLVAVVGEQVDEVDTGHGHDSDEGEGAAQLDLGDAVGVEVLLTPCLGGGQIVSPCQLGAVGEKKLYGVAHELLLCRRVTHGICAGLLSHKPSDLKVPHMSLLCVFKRIQNLVSTRFSMKETTQP